MVADAVSSRTQTDRQLALERMRTIGAHINTTESVILSLVGDASHPNFKEIQRLIKNVSPDTGLINSPYVTDSSNAKEPSMVHNKILVHNNVQASL